QKLFLSTIRLDRFDLRRRKLNMRGDKLIGLRKAQFLGCRDSQILLCIGRQRNGDAERGRQDPTWNVSHAEVPEALLEKETDCPEQMICAWRVRRVIERELVVHFQDDLWRREESHAKSVKLSLTLTGWQVLIGSGESASLQILVSISIKWHELPAVVNVVAQIDMIGPFKRETSEMLTHIIFRITIVIRAEIARCSDDHVNHFTPKL